MTKTRQLPYGVEDEVPQRPKRIPPAFLTFLSVLFTVLAGLGDWKTLNDTLKGLPKAIALGVIVCAFFYFLVDADILNFKKAMSYFPVYMLLIAVYTVISMYIWVSDFSKFSSISRAGQKILFQIITIIYAIWFYVIAKKSSYKLELAKPNLREIGIICFNGSSDMVSNLAGGVSVLFMNHLAFRCYGEVGVSALSVIT